MQSVVNQLNTSTGQLIEIDGDDLIGRFFHLSGSVYFAQTDIVNSVIDDLTGVVQQRDISEAMTGFSSKTQGVFGATTNLSLPGFFIDVDGDNLFVAAKDGDMAKVKNFMTASGANGSAFEGALYPTLFGLPFSGISTMSIIERANKQGIPIYNIGQNNLQALDRLAVSSAIKDDIKNAVAQGLQVTIPERNISLSGWTGAGYIIADPKTGAAGYMISGGTAGGEFVFDFLKDLLAAVERGAYGAYEELQEMLKQAQAALGVGVEIAGQFIKDSLQYLLAFVSFVAVEIGLKLLQAKTFAVTASAVAAAALARSLSVVISFVSLAWVTDHDENLGEEQEERIMTWLAGIAVGIVILGLVAVALSIALPGTIITGAVTFITYAAILLFSVLAALWQFILPKITDRTQANAWIRTGRSKAHAFTSFSYQPHEMSV